jgi:shikimate dehydrogenase
MTILEVQGSTSLCLVIGDPIAHSLSPRMHNAAYHAAGVSYVMAAARVAEADLPAAISGVRALNIKGLAVTMPHKVALVSLVDELEPTAKAIGAINTIVNQNGTLMGYNTDWLGILRPLEQRTSLHNKKVALLGAGGAAQAALYACTSHGAAVTIFNRTVSKAQALGAAWKVPVLPLDTTQRFDQFDIIINTTAVGMGPLASELPIEAHQLSKHQIVFETIYHPFETKLIKAAQERGASCIHGLDMFLEQGAAPFELHTGVKAPRAVMKSILQNALPS